MQQTPAPPTPASTIKVPAALPTAKFAAKAPKGKPASPAGTYLDHTAAKVQQFAYNTLLNNAGTSQAIMARLAGVGFRHRHDFKAAANAHAVSLGFANFTTARKYAAQAGQAKASK